MVYQDLEQHEKTLFNHIDEMLLNLDVTDKKKVLIAILNKYEGLKC